MSTNLTLRSVLDWVRTNARMAPLWGVGGVPNEPGLSICQDVIQEILSAPYAWRFNRANVSSQGIGILPFTTLVNVQDYALTNASAQVATVASVHIDTVANSGATVSGSTMTVNTKWAHGFSANQTVTITNLGYWNNGAFTTISQYNGSFTIGTVPTTTSFTVTVTPQSTTTVGAPGINDLGWVERCVLEDFASTSNVKPRHDIEVVANLPLESIVQPPYKISPTSRSCRSGGLHQKNQRHNHSSQSPDRQPDYGGGL